MKKNWPIYPTQLIMAREGCECADKGGQLITTTKKCAHCGIITENAALGDIYSLFKKLNLPMVLYERVTCQCDNVRSKIKIQKEEDTYTRDGYYEYKGKLYHSIECIEVYKEQNTPCYKARQNPDKDSSCIKRDLVRVSETFTLCTQGKLGEFECYNGAGRDFYYRVTTCDEARDECGSRTSLREIIFPLFTDYPNKEKTQEPIAFLFIGQLSLENEEITDAGIQSAAVEESDGDNLHEKSPKLKTVSEVMELYGETLCSFADNVVRQTGTRRVEYLYAKQAELQKIFENSLPGDGNNVKIMIQDVFGEIGNSFDLKRCLLFLPDFNKITLSGVYTAYDCILKKESKETVFLQKIPKDIKNGCISGGADLSCIFEGLERNGNCDIFVYRNNEPSGLALLLEWDMITDAPRNEHKNFFNTLLSTCFSHIMARVAEIKRDNIARFTESTRHDLAQKLGRLSMHNDGYGECLHYMERIIRRGVPRDKDFRAIIDDIYKKSSDYRKDMVGLYHALGFSRRTLDTAELIEKAESTSFQPYSKFLFNMREQYNNSGETRGKRLYLIAPSLADPELVADAAMVERIVSNLLDNANKYAYDGTNIYIRSFYDPGAHAYMFEVTNYGPGLKDPKDTGIFGWGVRGNNNGGGGYGLAIAQAYADKHGGTLEVTYGIIGKDEPESEICVPGLAVAETLKERGVDFPWPEGWENEMRHLSHLSPRHELNWGIRLESRYDEIISQDISSLFEGISLTPARLKVYKTPTYRVTFTAKIPMQEKNKEE